MSPECRHMHVMGRRCGSPALSGQSYCYFHARSRTRHRVPPVDPTPTIIHPLNADSLGQLPPMLAAPAPLTLTLDFPTIEDRESIQVSASMILTALGRNILEPRRAATMLYALQVATAVTRPDDDGISEYLVETETVISDDGAELAPEAAPEPAPELAPELAPEEDPEEIPAPAQPAIQFLQLPDRSIPAPTEHSCPTSEPLRC